MNHHRMSIMNRSNIWLKLGIAAALIATAFLLFGHWGYGLMGGDRSWWPMSQWGHGGMMAYGGGWGIGSGMGIGMLLYWGVILIAIVLLISGLFSRTNRPDVSEGRSEDAIEILKKRYARGEIDKAEFEAKRRDLNA